MARQSAAPVCVAQLRLEQRLALLAREPYLHENQCSHNALGITAWEHMHAQFTK
jgi:hypothetical protein